MPSWIMHKLSEADVAGRQTASQPGLQGNGGARGEQGNTGYEQLQGFFTDRPQRIPVRFRIEKRL